MWAASCTMLMSGIVKVSPSTKTGIVFKIIFITYGQITVENVQILVWV